MMFNSVDLPQPEGPTNTKNSPCSKSMSMSRKTCAPPNDLLTWLTERKLMTLTVMRWR